MDLRSAFLASFLALGIAPVAPAGAQTAAPEAVRAIIQRVMREQGTASVSIAAAKDGRIVWEEGFGLANHERNVAATPTTMYSLASISKAFTGTGLMVLVQRGLVKLDAPVNDYLGPAKLTALEGSATDATIRRVANHTSGLPTHYRFFYSDEPDRPPTADDAIRRYGILITPPGTRANYSNLGFGILDYIIARTSHTPFELFMRREVFTPLGLQRTAVVTAPITGDTVAERYDRAGKAIPWYDFDHRGASAVYSSAHDLIRFGLFHLKSHLRDQRQILADSTLDAMHRATARHSEKVGYGVGWRTHYQDYGYTAIGHTGGMPGVATMLRLYPEDNAAIVVLTNSANTAVVGEISRAVAAALLPKFDAELRAAPPSPPSPPPRVLPPPELHGEWSGTVRTWNGTVPIHLSVRSDNTVGVRLGKAAETAVAEVQWRDSLLVGTFAGVLPTEDVNRHPYQLRLNLALHGDRLSGAVMAEGAPNDDPRLYYALASYARLDRAGNADAGHQGGGPAQTWIDPSPHRVSFIHVAPDVALEVLDWGGHGDPLVFLHGAGNTGHAFDDFAPRLVDQYHVYAITRRGNGASSRPPSGYTITTVATDMKAVFDSLGVERAHIAGHSFGGDVETKFALLFPSRVRSLVYLDAAHDRKGLAPGEPVPAPTRPAATAEDSASAGSMRAYLARVNGTTWPEGEIRAFYRLGPDGRVIGRADKGAGFIWTQMRPTLERPDYAHIKAPALAFYALQPKPEQAFSWYATMDAESRAKAEGNATAWYDWAVQQMEAFRKEIPDGRVVTIIGGNHFVFSSNESEVLREMRDFMRRH